jgi:hypothetical protein
MRRHLMTFTLAGLFGTLLFLGDAQACCHKKRCPAPCPAPVVECAPAPVCAPVACAPKKKCHLFGGMKFGCHKKAACAAPVATCAPTYYEAPAWAPAPSPQAAPSGQGY